MEEKERVSKRKITRRFLTKSVFGAILIIIILILALGAGIYIFGMEGKVISKIAEFVPFPVASVNGHFVFFSDFMKVKEALKQADNVFASRGVISKEALEKNTKDLDKNILRGLIVQKEIENLLAERGAKVIDEEMNTETGKILSQIKGEEVVKNRIKELYNWDLEVYKQYVIKPGMERLKLEKMAEAELKEKTFNDFLVDKFNAANIKIFLKGYRFDKGSLSIVNK